MKQYFSGFYSPTESEFKEIWTKGYFVFDTNVLLNPYRFQSVAREVLLKAFIAVEERIWIPYQVGLEYHFHMMEEIIKQRKEYEILEMKLLNKVSELEADYKKHSARHTHLKLPQSLHQKYSEIINEIVADLKIQKSNHPDLNDVKEKMLSIFDGKIGAPFEEKQLEKIYEDGEVRYLNKIPPGWADASDKKNKTKYYNEIHYKDEYGDLVMWKQTIKYAKDNQVDVLLVTDDDKEDWIKKIKGEKVGPQPELIQEFYRETNGKKIYICNTKSFLEKILTYIKVENLTSDEIQSAIDSINQYIKKEESEKEERENSNKSSDFIDDSILATEEIYNYMNSDYNEVERNKILRKEFDRVKRDKNSFSDNPYINNKKYDEYKVRVLCRKTNLPKIRKSIFKVHQMMYGSQPNYVSYTDQTRNAPEELYIHTILIGSKMNIDDTFIGFLIRELDHLKIDAKLGTVSLHKSVYK
ncbi:MULTISPECIES: PIN-like domain-containing protein [Bacillus subtilis group]|nr:MULTISPECIES: PIN-like domain-containing protein [Bacillus subtilis group]WFO98102.1 DUF4935 domain-containing protein [Bacillus subtilis]